MMHAVSECVALLPRFQIKTEDGSSPRKSSLVICVDLHLVNDDYLYNDAGDVLAIGVTSYSCQLSKISTSS